MDVVRDWLAKEGWQTARNPSGNSGLMLACACGHDKIVSLLVEHEAPLLLSNANGDSALLFAALNSPATVRALGTNEALWRSVHRCNAGNLDAISCAIVSTHADNAEVLLILLSRAKGGLSFCLKTPRKMFG